MANNRQSGAVSIFSVIFAALLLSVLTVGFIKLMTQEQQRATNQDLSQSAYDAALAGVEDAKRAVRACTAAGNSTACDALRAAPDCKVVARAGISGSTSQKETIIQSTTSASGGKEFNQAYTCVNINMDTPDYLFESSEGKSQIIPLRSKVSFNQIIISWYMSSDRSDKNTPSAKPTGGSYNRLPTKANWGANTPPLIRAQLITPGSKFRISDLDKSQTSQTAFIRPGAVGSSLSSLSIDMSSRARATDYNEYSNSLDVPSCSANFQHGGYSCRVVLKFNTVTSDASQSAFLRLTTIYKGAKVKVNLASDGRPVNFDGVQPSVDSTGRASNLFRRVDARLKIGEDFSYPEYAADINNSICKDFSVSNSSASPGECSP